MNLYLCRRCTFSIQRIHKLNWNTFLISKPTIFLHLGTNHRITFFSKKNDFPSFPVATHLGPTKLPNVTHFLSFLQPKCLHLGYLMGLARHIYPHLLFHQDAREKMEFSIREDIKKNLFLSEISGKFKLNDPNLLKSRVGSQVWYNCTK